MSENEENDAPAAEEGAPAWMATFGDLMSLLLCFFVLLMSFASMDVRRFAVVSGSMRDAFGVQRVHPGMMEAIATSIVPLSDTESTPFIRVIDVPARLVERDQSLIERIKMSLRDQELERLMHVESTVDGVAIRVPGGMLFPAGSAELQPESVVFLHDVATLIRETPGDVSIDGHTDQSPVATEAVRSNWHLSSARAVAALVHLVEVERVEPERLRATGYGASRPLPEFDDPAENRRVEFVFLRDRGEALREAMASVGAEGSGHERGAR